MREFLEEEEEEDGREKENVIVLDKILLVNDVMCMVGLLEIIVIFWKSIDRSMENNKEVKFYIINKFVFVFLEYLKVFKDDCCKIFLFMLMFFMLVFVVFLFSCGVIFMLRS